MDDRSGEFTEIIQRFLPIIGELFRDFVPGSFTHPTEHLDKKLRESNQLIALEQGFNSFYRIDVFDPGYQVVLQVNKNSFAILIVPLDNFENTNTTTNISFSPDRSKQMYIYGIKANGEGPKISGNTLNLSSIAICNAMHIPELYISDSAGIRCHWNPSMEVQHFSLLRVMIGKPTFYSSLPGHFFNVDAAMSEIAMLQREISEDDKAYIRYYLDLSRTSGDCNRINDIIAKGMSLLKNPIEIFRFVATPYIPTGGRRKKTRRSRRKKKYTKKI